MPHLSDPEVYGDDDEEDEDDWTYEYEDEEEGPPGDDASFTIELPTTIPPKKQDLEEPISNKAKDLFSKGEKAENGKPPDQRDYGRELEDGDYSDLSGSSYSSSSFKETDGEIRTDIVLDIGKPGEQKLKTTEQKNEQKTEPKSAPVDEKAKVPSSDKPIKREEAVDTAASKKNPPAPPSKPSVKQAPAKVEMTPKKEVQPPPPPPPSKPVKKEAPPPPWSKSVKKEAPTPSKPIEKEVPPPPPSKPVKKEAPPPPPSKPVKKEVPPPPPSKPVKKEAPPPPPPSKTVKKEALPTPPPKQVEKEDPKTAKAGMAGELHTHQQTSPTSLPIKAGVAKEDTKAKAGPVAEPAGSRGNTADGTISPQKRQALGSQPFAMPTYQPPPPARISRPPTRSREQPAAMGLWEGRTKSIPPQADRQPQKLTAIRAQSASPSKKPTELGPSIGKTLPTKAIFTERMKTFMQAERSVGATYPTLAISAIKPKPVKPQPPPAPSQVSQKQAANKKQGDVQRRKDEEIKATERSEALTRAFLARAKKFAAEMEGREPSSPPPRPPPAPKPLRPQSQPAPKKEEAYKEVAPRVAAVKPTPTQPAPAQPKKPIAKKEMPTLATTVITAHDGEDVKKQQQRRAANEKKQEEQNKLKAKETPVKMPEKKVAEKKQVTQATKGGQTKAAEKPTVANDGAIATPVDKTQPISAKDQESAKEAEIKKGKEPREGEAESEADDGKNRTEVEIKDHAEGIDEKTPAKPDVKESRTDAKDKDEEYTEVDEEEYTEIDEEEDYTEVDEEEDYTEVDEEESISEQSALADKKEASEKEAAKQAVSDEEKPSAENVSEHVDEGEEEGVEVGENETEEPEESDTSDRGEKCRKRKRGKRGKKGRKSAAGARSVEPPVKRKWVPPPRTPPEPVPMPPIEKSICEILKEELRDGITPIKRYAKKARDNEITLPSDIPWENEAAIYTQKGMGAFGRFRDSILHVDDGEHGQLVEGSLKSETCLPLFEHNLKHFCSQKEGYITSFGAHRRNVEQVVDHHKYESDSKLSMGESIIRKIFLPFETSQSDMTPFGMNRSQLTRVAYAEGMKPGVEEESNSFISRQFKANSSEMAGSHVIDRRRQVIQPIEGVGELKCHPISDCFVSRLFSNEEFYKKSGSDFGAFRPLMTQALSTGGYTMNYDQERLCALVIPFQHRSKTLYRRRPR